MGSLVVELTNKGVVVCSGIVTVVDEATVVDWVVESIVGTRVVVGCVDWVESGCVVELTNKVVEVVGETVVVVGSKVGVSVTEVVDAFSVVVGD